MSNVILKYQEAFKKMCDEFEKSEVVRGAMVFGSMITGDLWEESDIDIILILDEKFKEVKNIYTEANKVPVHIKALSKENFIDINNNLNECIQKDLTSSRLIISKDSEIADRFNSLRYIINNDEKKWSLIYLSQLLKDIKVCKKYISNGEKYTAFPVAIRCVDSFSKLFVIDEGYMVNKDAISVCLNLNDKWKDVVKDLFFKEDDKEEAIKNVLKYIDKYIMLNIKKSSSLLLDILRENRKFLSSEEIKNNRVFKDINISMEEILNELLKKDIIRKEKRTVLNFKGTSSIKENVYSYSGL